jgi:predicted transcriptional regulator
MAKKRRDKEANQALIHDTYVALIVQHKRQPIAREIAQACGLTTKTIYKHLAELKFDPIAHPLRVLTDSVVISVYMSARKGNTSAQKFWFQLMEGWVENSSVDLGFPEFAVIKPTIKSTENVSEKGAGSAPFPT